MDTLKEHPFVDAFHVKNPLVTQKIGSVDLNNATEKLLEALWIKGLVGFKNKRTDVVVVRRLVMTVIMVWIGAGRGIMIMAVIMTMCVRVIMTMVVVVIVVVRGIGMIVSEKLWIDIQDGVEIKAADIDDLF
jgi:hypothetical protein